MWLVFLLLLWAAYAFGHRRGRKTAAHCCCGHVVHDHVSFVGRVSNGVQSHVRMLHDE